MSFALFIRHTHDPNGCEDRMTTMGRQQSANDEHAVAAATAGDEEAFAALTRRHRRELHVHCYRMLASFEDAEDLVQETFLRAWQKRHTFQGRASFRAWLYRIATNACLDFLARHERRVMEIEVRGNTSVRPTTPHVAWLQPYPDRLLGQPDGSGTSPEDAVVRKESIELAYIVALQCLPPRQRAVLLLRDVLDWSAAETARLLDASVAAVNSALQRARATIRQRGIARDDVVASTRAEGEDRRLAQQYVEATERGDTDALIRMLSRDAFFTMPPAPIAFAGNRDVVESWIEGGFGLPPFDDFRCIITHANGMPAVVNYIRRPGDSHHSAFALDVLRIERGMITEIIAFELDTLVEAFGIPRTLQ